MECRHQLMCRGIPISYLPYDLVDNVAVLNNKMFFNKWLKVRKTIEKDPNHSYRNMYKLFGVNDVLCINGQVYQKHSGNRKFREILDEDIRHEYRRKPADDKPAYIENLIERITSGEKALRFVCKVDDGIWMNVTHNQIVKKVKYLLNRQSPPPATQPETASLQDQNQDEAQAQHGQIVMQEPPADQVAQESLEESQDDVKPPARQNQQDENDTSSTTSYKSKNSQGQQQSKRRKKLSNAQQTTNPTRRT